MKNKIIILLLIFSLVLPSAVNGEGLSVVNQEDQEQTIIMDTPNHNFPVINSSSVSGSVYDSDWPQRLLELNAKSLENSNNRFHKQNRYIYSKKDLETLILSGATEEDIYLSDLLGNEWLVNPQELIQLKKAGEQTWDEIESGLTLQKEEQLQSLLLQDPRAESFFALRTMNVAEKLEVLEAANSSRSSLEQALNQLEVESTLNIQSGLDTPLEVDFTSNLSVLKSVYSVDGSLESPSVLEQPRTIANYTQDINGIYNGLITQTQINQTAKPQYSDGYGSSEVIDPSSGKLVWKETQISLPGRDGLDLNIGVINQNNYAYMYQKTYGISGNLKKANYLLSRYDLGVGWAFQFPSIQLAEGGYLYYHKGDGAVYRIDFSAYNNPDNYTHLVGYQGKDVKLLQDTQGLFTNGQASSTYYLEYANKKREYFAGDGRLLGIVDQYGNTITFQHIDRKINDKQTYKVISSITDSIGRVVTFTYDTTLQDTPDTSFIGEAIVVAVKDLDGNVTQTIKYMKTRSNDTFNGNPDGHSPFLWYIQNQINEYTYFTNEYFQNNKFDYDRSFDSSYAGSTSLHPIKMIQEPRSISNYQYEKVTRRLGSSGFAEDYRIVARNNQVRKNGAATGDYNHINYSYSGDYSGYNPASPYSNPSSYVYATTQTTQSTSQTGGLATTTNYNNQGQVTSMSTRASNGERKVISNVTFDPTYTSMPTATESRVYSSDSDTSPSVLYSSAQYTDWGGIQSQTVPLTQVQYNDATIKSKYTTSYTYEPTYYFLKTTSGYQNNNILLSEQYDYYPNGRIKSYSNPKGEVTNYCYEALNASGGLVSNCADPNVNVVGKITKIKTMQSLGNGQTAVNETIFNSSTVYAYPSETKSYFTTKSGSGADLTQIVQKTMTYNMGRGLLDSEINGNGQVTSYQYDALGRPTQIKYPSFTNANDAIYDVLDEISYTNAVTPSGADAENATVSSLLVSSQRKYVQKSNNATTLLSVQKDYYDGLGFLRYSQQSNNGVTQITQYRSDDLTRAVYAIDPMNNTTTMVYDAWGAQKEALDTFGNLYVSESDIKLLKGIHYFVAASDIQAYRNNPANNLKSSYVEQDYDQWGQLLVNKVYKDWPTPSTPLTELYSYDFAGNLISYTDPKKNLNNEGVTTKYTYDALNRLSEVKDALGQVTKYPYNISGQITNTVVQSNESDTPKVISTKAYNEVGSVTSKTDPSSKSNSYIYNNLGLLQQSTDRNGTLFSYQYDEQNRPTQETATSTGAVTQQNKLIVGSSGILIDTQENYNNGVKSSSLTTQMDNLRRITSIQVQGANSTYTSSLGISYDKNNRITQYKIGANASNNFYTQYKYDRTRVDKVQTNGQLALNDTVASNVNYTYFPNGQVQFITYPPLADGSVLKTEYVYDNLKRLYSITNTKGNTILSSYVYSYDSNGNIETISQTLINQAPKTNSYSYDKLNRMIGITRADGSTVSYSYDLRGNRLTLIDTTNLPSSYDDTSYQYDLNNTLVSTTKGDLITNFEYSPDGLRYRKTTGIDVKQYRYNANKEVISEVNGSNVTTANYVRGDRLLVKKDVATNKDYYYLYNGHGDVIQMIDTSGTVVNSYEYDEWGNITQQTEQVPNEFKYAGEIYDKETGLYYLRARYYDPSMGRFINEDTYEGQINNPLSFNLYTYVHNNPLKFTDPSGHAPVGPGSGATFDSNQWKYLSNLAQNGKSGQVKWANDQIKQGLYYKSSAAVTGSQAGATVALPAPGIGAGVGAGISTAVINGVTKVAGALGMLLTLSGSEANFEKEKRNTVYRALTPEDKASLASGNGLVAKNVSGEWSPFDHIMKGSQAQALVDDPWISTTTDLSVARSFDSGNGIVSIDLRKVTSPYVYQFAEYDKNSKIMDERIAYNRAVWSREISIYQYVPQGAITSYVK